jgi:hypothetical protein
MDHGLKSHPANRFGHLDGHKTVDGRRIGLILVTTRSIRLVFFHVCVNILQTCIVTISIHIYIYTPVHRSLGFFINSRWIGGITRCSSYQFQPVRWDIVWRKAMALERNFSIYIERESWFWHVNYTGLIGIVYLTPLEFRLTRRYFMGWDTCSARHLVQLKVSLATYASYPEMIADFNNCVWWAIDDVNWWFICLFEIGDSWWLLAVIGDYCWLLVAIGIFHHFTWLKISYTPQHAVWLVENHGNPLEIGVFSKQTHMIYPFG